MDLEKWKSLSSRFGHVRSDELKNVDQAVTQYVGSSTVANLKTLAERIIAWQISKTNWLSDSTRSGPMRDLVNLVKQTASTDWPDVGGRIFNHIHSTAQLASFTNDPVTWLNTHPLSISGGNDGQRDFYLIVDHPDPTYASEDIGTGFVITPGVPRYQLSANETYGAKIANAMCIKMHSDINNTSTAAVVTNHLVAVVGNVMVTGMLNGCTFLIDNSAGANNLKCTHIKPVGQTPEALQDQIRGFNLPSTRVYGQRDYGPSECIALLGVTNGSWRIFAQLTPRGGGATVTRVDPLYP